MKPAIAIVALSLLASFATECVVAIKDGHVDADEAAEAALLTELKDEVAAAVQEAEAFAQLDAVTAPMKSSS